MLPFNHGVGVVNHVTHFEQIFTITMKEKITSGLFMYEGADLFASEFMP